jgi:hypothetical protein
MSGMEPFVNVRLPVSLWELVKAAATAERRSASAELAALVERALRASTGRAVARIVTGPIEAHVEQSSDAALIVGQAASQGDGAGATTPAVVVQAVAGVVGADPARHAASVAHGSGATQALC